MPWVSRAIYAALVWKERQKSGRAVPSSADLSRGAVGRRGEVLAYWFLRSQGYTIVARNLRLRKDVGELDMVGWDGPVLAFIEVKTRVSDLMGPPELAISAGQKRRITHAANVYLRRLRHKEVNYRFDVVSVTWHARHGFQARLIKDSFRAKYAI